MSNAAPHPGHLILTHELENPDRSFVFSELKNSGIKPRRMGVSVLSLGPLAEQLSATGVDESLL